jgi:SAM-dependent methyltransferase
MKDRFETFNEGPVPDEESRNLYAHTSSPQDSEVEVYEEDLNIKLEELIGKKVLDMGGMMGGDFADRAKEAGVDLIILDPQNPYGMRGGKNVTGIMQELPFADETFDIELSHGALPYMPNYEQEYLALFTDILRTLKPEGKAVISPLTKVIKESEAFNRVLEDIRPFSTVTIEPMNTHKYSPDKDGKPREFFRIIIIKDPQ